MSKKHKAHKLQQNVTPAALGGPKADAPAPPEQQAASTPVPPALDGQSASDGRGGTLSGGFATGDTSQRFPLPLVPSAAEPSMKKYLFVFWIAVALAVAAAWTLEYFMPLTHEYIIERWIMLAFGGFLVVFLFFLK